MDRSLEAEIAVPEPLARSALFAAATNQSVGNAMMKTPAAQIAPPTITMR